MLPIGSSRRNWRHSHVGDENGCFALGPNRNRIRERRIDWSLGRPVIPICGPQRRGKKVSPPTRNLPSAAPSAPSAPAPAKSAKTSPNTKPTTIQDNKGGSNNTNTQVGTAQGPIAIAPNGIANAAPNFGTQSVINAPPQRSLTPDQRRIFISALQKTCPFEVAVRLCRAILRA
jgi:hypothetical protein